MKKNLIVKQHDIKDCGAACLLSIIKFYNGNINLEKIKMDTCISKNGITAFNIIKSAKQYGFDAKGIKISFKDLMQNKIMLPAIAYLELKNGLKHYVVIYEIHKKYLLIMDPAQGIKKIVLSDFKRDFKEVLLIFSPITKIVNYKQGNSLLKMFFQLFINEKKLIISLFIISLMITILSIILSFHMKSILSSITNNLFSSFCFISLLFFLITFLKIFLEYIRNYYETYLNKNIDANILPSFLNHIENLPLNALSNRTTGEIIKRVEEMNNIKDLFSNIILTVGLNLLLAFTSWFVLYNIDNKLTIILFIVMLIYLLNNMIWMKPINNWIENNIDKETLFHSKMHETFPKLLTMKSNLNYFSNQLEESLISFQLDSFLFQKRIIIYQFINNFIIEIGLFLLLTIGFYNVMNNTLEFIDLITYNSLYLYFINPIKEIVNLVPKYVYIKKSFQKINDFIMLEEESLNDSNESFISGDISFKNITFSYNQYDYPIRNFSLDIRKGDKVLVTGKSGSGKSTLFKLLYRLYDIERGSILINNINIKDYSLKTIRENITYVSQDEGIMNDTLLNNITMGKATPLKDLNKILELCEINNILDKKALRLESFIMEDGSNLSGGEKARIFLARALVKNNDIIIFDETFSSLEETDANRIINNILTLYSYKTIIIISHFKPQFPFNSFLEGDSFYESF